MLDFETIKQASCNLKMHALSSCLIFSDIYCMHSILLHCLQEEHCNGAGLLNEDLWLEIFKQMTEVEILQYCSLVCRAWRAWTLGLTSEFMWFSRRYGRFKYNKTKVFLFLCNPCSRHFVQEENVGFCMSKAFSLFQLAKSSEVFCTDYNEQDSGLVWNYQLWLRGHSHLTIHHML